MTLLVRELTAPAPGAVAVVAIEGHGARPFARELVGRELPLGLLVLAHLRLAGAVVDEALVACRSDAEVELHLHGSVPLVRHVRDELQRLAAAHDGRARGFARAGGAPMGSQARAPASSVTSSRPRAPLDELELRALELAARAPSAEGARIALDQAAGALRSELEALVRSAPSERGPRLAALLERARVARFALEPVHVVLAGPVNAGKSTLFNVLLGHERAITSDRAGTTRDVLTEPAFFGPWPVWLSDSAGERDLVGDDAALDVERAGQALARRVASAASLVLWLEPTASGDDAEGARTRERALRALGSLVVRIGTRAAESVGARAPAIAALEDPRGARAIIEAVFRSAFALPARAWTPGAAVPLDPELVRALEAASAAPEARDVGAHLAPWLGTT
ncbi:MAG: 50S ribosome-binding GTPase [Planctomycetes bacterium]|nr:50S ribosome-binding GTPase [Planctomycetota bacterium]